MQCISEVYVPCDHALSARSRQWMHPQVHLYKGLNVLVIVVHKTVEVLQVQFIAGGESLCGSYSDKVQCLGSHDGGDAAGAVHRGGCASWCRQQ